MHEVSKAINILDPTEGIDKKICKTGSQSSSWTSLEASSHGDKDTNVIAGTKCATKTGLTAGGLMEVVSDANGPTDSSFTQTTKMGVLPNTSANISKDISKLNKDQHGIVSSAFAKAHEGAEIVEIRSISTTSVMVNACYDVLAEGLPVSPYGCAGIGANFVSVVDGHITPKLSYKLKGGFSYGITPEINAFVGGYYMKVLGNDEYTDLPVEKMVDDASSNTKDAATATFDLSYFGAELGVRFMF